MGTPFLNFIYYYPTVQRYLYSAVSTAVLQFTVKHKNSTQHCYSLVVQEVLVFDFQCSRLFSSLWCSTEASQGLMALRVLRSVLYVPAINAKAVAKARTLDIDAVILDLEDAVAPASKVAARSMLASHLAGDWGHRCVAVRINGRGTPWHAEDLSCVASLTCAAIVLPKVESAEEVRDAGAAVAQSSERNRTPLWAMIETPFGVLNASSIAAETRRRQPTPNPLTCLVAGTSDLTVALGAKHVPGRQPLLPALSAIVLAARAYGLTALDGVCLQVPPPPLTSASSGGGPVPSQEQLHPATAAFIAECAQGRALGFHGKTLIHPTQIPGSNAAFGPSADDVNLASRIVAAYDAALGRGDGVVVVDGRLIEAMHVSEARSLLSMAQDIAKRGGASAAAAGAAY
jgi:citrate lyase subunit beta / citryl-CoA lyase